MTPRIDDLVRTGLDDLRAEAGPFDPDAMATSALRQGRSRVRATVATGTVVAALVAVAVTATTLSRAPDVAVPAPPDPRPGSSAAPPATVEALLENAALVASTSTGEAPRPDQFFYTRSVIVTAGGIVRPGLGPRYVSESWLSVDGHLRGLIVNNGRRSVVDPFAATDKTWPTFRGCLLYTSPSPRD